MRAMWSPLSLSLLVPRIRALHTDDAVTPDHLAFPADGLDRCSYLHVLTPLLPARLRPAQDIGAVGSDGNGVLEVGRQPSIAGGRRPAILLHVHFRTSRIDHGLDRQHQPLGEPDSARPGTVVRHLGGLVELAADPVPDELAYQAEARALRHVLDGAGDVPDVGSRPDGLDAGRERGGGHGHQSLRLRGDGADGHRPRGIPEVAVVAYPEVQ